MKRRKKRKERTLKQKKELLAVETTTKINRIKRCAILKCIRKNVFVGSNENHFSSTYLISIISFYSSLSLSLLFSQSTVFEYYMVYEFIGKINETKYIFCFCISLLWITFNRIVFTRTMHIPYTIASAYVYFKVLHVFCLICLCEL